ncbi:thioredoxin family protein [Photobacterium leiognathi]|uniref:thioredoxin family protein n=1 Tax=Photobacterium leiognathi TaxID=553611 RepID=UPI002981A3F4|nr:thioredoxin family protein [Photobacterium leiognathi]
MMLLTNHPIIMAVTILCILLSCVTLWFICRHPIPYKGLYSIGLGIIIGLCSIFLFTTIKHLERQASLTPTPTFIAVHSIDDLELALAEAANQQQPVLLDVTADWCSPCIAYKKETFPAPKVAKQLNQYTLLQANVTANTPQDLALMQHLNVTGFPTLLFWDKKGEAVTQAEVIGFMDADEFSEHLRQQALHIQ